MAIFSCFHSLLSDSEQLIAAHSCPQIVCHRLQLCLLQNMREALGVKAFGKINRIVNAVAALCPRTGESSVVP